jgi:hypothetical protein
MSVLSEPLYAYARDVNLPEGYLERYRVGLIFREPTFCDASEHKQGLAAKHRFLLLSGSARHVDALFGGMSGSPGTGLCVWEPGSLWKVLAVHHAKGYSSITLLEVPLVAFHIFSGKTLTPLEHGFAEKSAELFALALQLPVVEECARAEWLERLQHPLGIRDDGQFLESWFNGLHKLADTPLQAHALAQEIKTMQKPGKGARRLKRGSGVLVVLVGVYIVFISMSSGARLGQMILISSVMIAMGVWLFWRPDDIS